MPARFLPRVILYNHGTMKKFVFVLLIFLGMAVVYLSFGELQQTAEVLRQIHPWAIALGLLVELLWLFNVGLTFKQVYRMFDMRESSRHLFLVAAASYFVSVVAPSAGVSGVALLISDARKRGLPPGKVTAAGMVSLLFDYLSFLFVLALGLIVMIRRNNLTGGEVIASLILFAIASGLAFILYLGSRSANRLGDLLARATRLINSLARPFIHRKYLRVERAYSYAAELSGGLSTMRTRPRDLARPLALALLSKALWIVILMIMFMAFEVEFSIGTLVGGFSIGYLFLIVSPTPSGIGVVEGVLAVALRSLRVPWESAVVVTLCYRAITFWFPLAVGAIAFRILQRDPETKSAE